MANHFETLPVAIGSACFMGAPDETRIIELGYGINKLFRKKGYMTKALTTLSQWALQQPLIRCITVETEKKNLASHIVLYKVGYSRYKETEGSLYWLLKK